MRHLLFTTFLLAMNIAYAMTPSPESCTPVPYTIDNNNIVLTSQSEQPKTTQIYFFTNKSAQSIFIDRLTTNPGASAGWSSFIRPGNWAALVLNKKSFTLHCAMIEPGKVIALDCSKTITVCTPKNLTAKTPFKGNYWLAEDKDWESFVKILAKKGVSF